MITAHDASIQLEGGQWGAGVLTRASKKGDWRWIPATRLSMNMTRSAAYWTSDRAVQQLRLRAVATFPWANAGDLAIEPRRRLELEQDLPVSHLAGVVRHCPPAAARRCPRAHGNAGPIATPRMP